MMRTMIIAGLLAGTSLANLGCQFIARSPQDYERDTRQLLDQNSSAVKQCYDSHLQSQDTAGGTVVVNFTVAEETGVIKDVQVDEGASSAPGPLQECVAQSITGLTLEPPDARKGLATFTYELVAGSPPAAVPAES